MALRNRAVPEEVTKVIDRWKNVQGQDQVRRADSACSHLPASYPAYYLGLLAVVSGENASNAVFVGWRNFVPSSKGDLHVTVHALTNTHFMISRHRSFSKNEVECSVLNKLSQPRAHKGRRFELRALNIPPLVNLAIWLKSEDGGVDLLIPVDACVKALVPAETYKADEFFSRLLKPARDLMEFQLHSPGSTTKTSHRRRGGTEEAKVLAKPSSHKAKDSRPNRSKSAKGLDPAKPRKTPK